MKIKLIITLVLAVYSPLMNICSGSSASAQYWSSESGSLWDLADNTGYYEILRCEYCERFVCGYSKEEVAKNMKSHLYICAAYQAYLECQKNDNNSWNDLDENNDTGSGNGNSNGNSSSSVVGMKVVDLFQAASEIQTLGFGNKYTIMEEYDYYFNNGYVSYPYVLLTKFAEFIRRRYKARDANPKNDFAYPFIGLKANDFAVVFNGKYYVVFQVCTFNREDYDYVFEF